MMGLIALVAYCWVAIWTLKAARSTWQMLVGAAPVVPFLACGTLLSALLPELIALLATLAVQIGCVLVTIRIGGYFRDSAMQAVIEADDAA